MSIEKSLNDAWENTRKTFAYPNLAYPSLIDDDSLFANDCEAPTSTAAINMLNHKITVNKNFVEYLNKRGLDEKLVLNGLLHHEVNHYMYCPYNLSTFLLINNAVSKISKTHANEISNYFQDVIINLDLMQRKKDTNIEDVYRVMEKEHNIDKLICAYYQKKTGNKMNVKLRNSRIKKKLDLLDKIDYFDKAEWVNNSSKFAKIIHRMFRKDSQKNLKPLDQFNPNAYSKEEKEKAIREVVKELSPEDFKETIERTGLQTDFLEANIDIVYYDQLSRNYRVKVREIPTSSNGDSIPFEHKHWEVGEPTLDIDYFNSYGKFLPGITQKWVRKEGVNYGSLKEIPNLIVAIDSSGSMIHPGVNLSNAVLGAYCAVNSYIANGASVATYNFSTDGLVTEFSRDKKKILSNLINYQGMSTIINNDVIIDLVNSQKKNSDLLIISDLEISNIDDMFKSLNRIEKNNRVTIVHITDDNSRKKTYTKNKIKVYSVKNPQDIPLICIGESEKILQN